MHLVSSVRSNNLWPRPSNKYPHHLKSIYDNAFGFLRPKQQFVASSE